MKTKIKAAFRFLLSIHSRRRRVRRAPPMETGKTAALPDDALFNVLRRLPPRSLAVARCVCKAWRGVVDDRARLLRVPGIFINYNDYYLPRFFARPATMTPLDFMSCVNSHDDVWSILDHCGGLLLCHVRCGRELCVCNPTTRRWTVLPGNTDGSHRVGAYLAFDPAVSPHYEVLLVQKPWEEEFEQVPSVNEDTSDDDTSSFHVDGEVESAQGLSLNEDQSDPSDGNAGSMEWPSTPWKVKVFSSRTRRWEDRDFVREGKPAGMVKDVWAEPTLFGSWHRYAVYLEGALYIYCPGHFIARLLLSDGKYQVIKTPTKIGHAKPYLGRSGNRVCFGRIRKGQLQVWILTESCENMEWALKYQYDLRCYAKHIRSLCNDGKLMDGPWTVKEYGNVDTPEREGVEWDSDNDDILAPQIEYGQYYHEDLAILGFHPYKEVVYLASTLGVMAYHLDSSRAQYLGISCPDCYYYNHITNCISESFIYTPSFVGHLENQVGQARR